MFTNTYTPHVGGVAKSVATQVEWLKQQGHSCLVIAPYFPNTPAREEGVVRVPAIEDFNKSGFSLRLPISHKISRAIELFEPEIIHSHHPFLLGDTALRKAREFDIPLIFTHHTRYEDYAHYILKDSEKLEQLAINISVTYCNFTDRVIAPSQSIAALIESRGVTVPIEVIPTGIDPHKFENADGASFRKELNIPEDMFLLGHVGRIAEEKNLRYLVKAVKQFLNNSENTGFLLVGDGPLLDNLKSELDDQINQKRVFYAGKLTGNQLANAYNCMDLFVFSSKSETQGMVLAEAMMSGTPVVALDASGVREIIQDSNGTSLPENASTEEFAKAIHSWHEHMADESDPKNRKQRIRESVEAFTVDTCMETLVSQYQTLIRRYQKPPVTKQWERFLNRAEVEWDLLSQKTGVALSLFKDIEDIRKSVKSTSSK